MLCYVWNLLAADADKYCGKEQFDEIYNLMARILIASVKQLLKRGFHREYVAFEEPLHSLRGKIDIQQSIQKQTQIHKQLICNYDELSPDVPFNQIIKAAMGVLIKHKNLDEALCKELKLLRFSFMAISDIHPTRQSFVALHFNRNNQNYRLIINVCRLVFESLVGNEDDKDIKFADFIRSGQMAKLYEKFVLSYYSLHLPKNEYRVYSPKIKWDLDEENQGSLEYLPELQTDIVLENKLTNTQLIIDTKFYSNTLVIGKYGNEIVSPSNLHQIYTYISNSSFNGKIMGMLLYPTVEKELSLRYPIKNKPILIRTLNLAGSWNEIEESLMEVSTFTQAS